jgi:hypothetical protein
MPLLPLFDWSKFSTLSRSERLAVEQFVAQGGSAEDKRRLDEALAEAGEKAAVNHDER